MKEYVHMFALAVLAGIAIGIGGVVYLSVENKVAGALMFTVGLYTICVHGLNLYTGKVGYLVSQPPSYLASLLVIWLGNLAGTGLTAAAVSQTRISGICEQAALVCGAKMKDSFSSLFLLAVFCGFLMFAAVDGYKATGNPIILFMGVAAFILCGFEHCIADMFYFFAGSAWSLRAIAGILVITLGNSAGAALIPLVRKMA
ncbi:MAG: formate/nitrite transporter family protein [Eubacterium sp.]|nr:formate/nitrite transporter family protein [Eubacterium sp.]